MGDIKKEHKKFGKTILYSVYFEKYINDRCKTYGIELNNEDGYLKFPEKINRLKSNDKMKKEFKSKKKYKKNKQMLYELNKWWSKRNKLIHEEKIYFSKNSEFKRFLKMGKKLLKYFKIEISNDYKKDKLNAIGKFVYMSTFVEKHINNKCKKRNIDISIPMKNKIEEILKRNPKKVEKYKYIKEWWKKRNEIIHSIENLDEFSTMQINELVDEMGVLI